MSLQIGARKAALRTTLDIDEALIAEAQRLSGQATKKGTIKEALRLLARRQQEVESAFGRYPRHGDLNDLHRD